jgi:hypothetical protein
MKATFLILAATYAGLLISCSPTVEPESETTSYQETMEEPTLSPEEQQANEQAFEERTEIIRKLKDQAARDWPNDYTTQEFWVNEEMEAYDHMLTIPDDEIKQQAQRDWPLDFTTQKYWYYEQIEARERMK